MEVSFAVVAQAANEGAGGIINILGQFDGVQVASWPGDVAGAYVARVLSGYHDGDTDHKVSLRFVSEDGELLGPPLTAAYQHEPPKPGDPPGGLNLILPFKLRFPKAGAYHLELWLDGVLGARTTLQVRGPASESP